MWCQKQKVTRVDDPVESLDLTDEGGALGGGGHALGEGGGKSSACGRVVTPVPLEGSGGGGDEAGMGDPEQILWRPIRWNVAGEQNSSAEVAAGEEGMEGGSRSWGEGGGAAEEAASWVLKSVR